MAKKEQQGVNLGRVIMIGDYNYTYDQETEEWTHTGGTARVCDVLPVERLLSNRIVTEKYVLPLSDAQVYNSDKGLTYVYHAGLPYLKETAHLLEVEKNIVIGQAYLYQGKNIPNGKPNGLTWVLIIALVILAIIGMVK
ncbi:hypothetical protein P9314_05135 [Paenibacillus validus]|uniref:hypothetical protein n=1 Tax=Paenibacillus validus TaxID=44253 RepID=UPI000FD8AD1A|nr:hypothetical protein [Paenibacillus validus]MED4600093.1 hypothetical protein [Paenibacillus validus]MED4605541.1 hypothetical protein [Paenibacillus validus]